MIDAWTDYPIVELGDVSGQESPIRQCKVLSYNGDKYCDIYVCGIVKQVKACYIYAESGRAGDVPPLELEGKR